MDSAVRHERAVLGAVIQEPELILDLIATSITADDWSLSAHAEIFGSLAWLHEAGIPIDIITVADELARRSQLDLIGGNAYLADLTTGAIPSAKHVLYHFRRVMELARLRRLEKLGEWLQEKAAEPAAKPAEIAAMVIEQIAGIARIEVMA